MFEKDLNRMKNLLLLVGIGLGVLFWIQLQTVQNVKANDQMAAELIAKSMERVPDLDSTYNELYPGMECLSNAEVTEKSNEPVIVFMPVPDGEGDFDCRITSE